MPHPDSEFTDMEPPSDWDDDEADWDERVERKAFDHLQSVKLAGQRMQNDHPLHPDGTGSYAPCWAAVFMGALMGLGWMIERWV